MQVVGTVFTHHQKCVIVDTQASGNNRRISTFIGGLDLCDGRYDTPEHRLFRDLDSVFDGDFHNPTFPVSCHPNWTNEHCINFLFILLVLEISLYKLFQWTVFWLHYSLCFD